MVCVQKYCKYQSDYTVRIINYSNCFYFKWYGRGWIILTVSRWQYYIVYTVLTRIYLSICASQCPSETCHACIDSGGYFKTLRWWLAVNISKGVTRSANLVPLKNHFVIWKMKKKTLGSEQLRCCQEPFEKVSEALLSLREVEPQLEAEAELLVFPKLPRSLSVGWFLVRCVFMSPFSSKNCSKCQNKDRRNSLNHWTTSTLLLPAAGPMTRMWPHCWAWVRMSLGSMCFLLFRCCSLSCAKSYICRATNIYKHLYRNYNMSSSMIHITNWSYSKQFPIDHIEFDML